MPRDILVGDKVRLLGWEGFCGGLPLFAHMEPEVGTESEAIELATNGNVKLSNGYWWPSERLEPLDAPRPSAWTKTSDKNPDVGVWVLGWWDDAVRGIAESPQAVTRLQADGEWTDDTASEHADSLFVPPDYWQPLPAPPEVSK